MLAIDLGNTNIVIGVFGGKELLYHWRLSTQQWETADEFGISIKNLLATEGITPGQIRKIIMASVVPPLEEVLLEMSRRHFNLEPLLASSELIGMPILYHNPQEVGADRLVNALAGYQLYGGPLVIVDFGTATTFCLISARGEYLGGCIAPGIKLSAKVLHQYTAKLPQVEIVKPSQVPRWAVFNPACSMATPPWWMELWSGFKLN